MFATAANSTSRDIMPLEAGGKDKKHFFDRRRFTPPVNVSNLPLTSFPNLPNICSTKIAGRLKHFTAEWEKLTSDKAILDSAAHFHIEYIDNAHPTQHQISHQITFSDTEQCIIDAEITTLLEKGVIIPCESEQGEYISTVSVRPKKDGNYRMILNLKQLNSFVEYHHFKMDALTTAIKMMRKGCYMASVDLKDAYYTVPVAAEHQKFLKVLWRGCMYKFTCLSNGLACAPRVLPKC